IKLGVATVPTSTLVAARLILGTLILLAVLYLRGARLPPFGKVWGYYTLFALLGNCIPFTSITWGQQRTDSALAGILMAVMPLTTMVLAHFFVKGEHMTRNRLLGFILGFAGIVVLMEPSAFERMAEHSLATLSQLAILLGALCYAANSVLTRILARGDDVLVASTAMLLIASVIALPIALLADQPWRIHASATSLWAILWLGVGPTAIATVVYFKLIATAGPTFMSLVNYMSPAVAVLLGVALLGETPGVHAYIALALILLGIAVSQWRRGT
ncbi:MAG TPA: DMT family transporter, partial [Burkholderiales bacterium]|nr:DMT family transporter [Burkholderiales bacterium]